MFSYQIDFYAKGIHFAKSKYNTENMYVTQYKQVFNIPLYLQTPPPPTRLHGNLLRGFIITFHYSKHSLYFAEKKPQTGTAMWVVSDICLKSRDINKYPNTRLLPGITDH